jgi:K+ transporter
MPRDAMNRPGIAALGFAALGVVFGDIGTSPLYTLKTVLDLTGDGSPATILGVLSLIVWTLILITSVKYVTIAMRVDNDGEGGILALMALLGVKRQRRPAIVALGLLGAALIYGDGAITPAISVLSALEGLTIAAPGLGPYVVPTAVAILIALFGIQSRGTASIGRAFGPLMAVWFATIALLGIWGIASRPTSSRSQTRWPALPGAIATRPWPAAATCNRRSRSPSATRSRPISLRSSATASVSRSCVRASWSANSAAPPARCPRSAQAASRSRSG